MKIGSCIPKISKVSVKYCMRGTLTMSHYDYVMLPNGFKKKIFSIEDINKVLDEWHDYIESNWVTLPRKMFDCESKVKFMLDGLANIILRPNMSGMITEYKKMKIGKYEIPFSACTSEISGEIYSEYIKKDNGEASTRMKLILEELAAKYDEEKNSRQKKIQIKKRVHKLTRRDKIENIRKTYDANKFEWTCVDTEGYFKFDNKTYRISDDVKQYQAKNLPDGDVLYDMDKILCVKTNEGKNLFFDMNIEPVEKIFFIN